MNTEIIKAFLKKNGTVFCYNSGKIIAKNGETYFIAQSPETDSYELREINFLFSTKMASNFPEIESGKLEAEVIVELETLEKIAAASAKNDIRYYLNSVAFFGFGDCIAATDGRRLHWVGNVPEAGEQARILPICLMSSAISIAKKKKLKKLSFVFCDKKTVEVKINEIVLFARLIDARYPDIKRVIPASENASDSILCELSKKLLKDAKKIKGACLSFESQAIKPCTFINKEKTYLNFLSDCGAMQDCISSNFNVNASYIYDALTGDGKVATEIQFFKHDTKIMIKTNLFNALIMCIRV